MRLMFLLLLTFILTKLFFTLDAQEAQDPLVESTLKFFNETNATQIISYGIVISSNKILLPKDADKIYDDLGNIQYFDNKTHVPAKNNVFSFEELKNNFVLKLSFTSATYNNPLKISRYPANEEFTFKTVMSNHEYKPFTPEIMLLSSEKCAEDYPTFNEEKQVCANAGDKEDSPGKPLIIVIDDVHYLAGLSAPREGENSTTMFDLIVERDFTFPVYEECSYLRDSATEFSYCNSARITKNLIKFGHTEVVVIGNTPSGEKYKFIPVGLGTVISDNQAIIPSTVLKSLDNYEYYGNGNELKIAIMFDGISFAPQYNLTNFYKNMFALITFEFPFFKDTKKAKFLFDESLKEIKKNAKIDTFQFEKEQFKLQKNEQKRKPKFQKFLFGAPVFSDGKIVGFCDNDETFISVFKLKEYLQIVSPALITETSQPSNSSA